MSDLAALTTFVSALDARDANEALNIVISHIEKLKSQRIHELVCLLSPGDLVVYKIKDRAGVAKVEKIRRKTVQLFDDALHVRLNAPILSIIERAASDG